MGEQLWKKTLLFGFLLAEIICTAVGVHGPSSLLQPSVGRTHTETGTKAEQQGRILEDLPLSGTSVGIRPLKCLKKLRSSDFVQGYAGLLWQSRSCTSVLPFRLPSFSESPHKAQVPRVCASALHEQGGSPALTTKHWIY